MRRTKKVKSGIMKRDEMYGSLRYNFSNKYPTFCLVTDLLEIIKESSSLNSIFKDLESLCTHDLSSIDYSEIMDEEEVLLYSKFYELKRFKYGEDTSL